jgi:Sulfotransferase domain
MLKVIGAGFGRTGTNSLKIALEQLGFDKCHHMREVMENPDQLVYWQEALDTGTTDWETLFTGYQAAVDLPVAYFYKTQMALYPDAKIILTIRDPERWYDSVKNTIYKFSRMLPFASVLRFIIPTFRQVYPLLSFTQQMIWDGFFEERFEDKDFAIAKFNQWNESVIATVPADRLLIFEVKQGWESLCEFLNVPIPDTPFPHVNSREDMEAMMRARNPFYRLFNRG